MKPVQLTTRLLTMAVVVLVIGAVAIVVLRPAPNRTVTVHFPSSVGLYAGDDVRVLGVSVGSVRSVTPEAGSVRVELDYRSDVQLPADVKAALVAATLVTGRYVQLAPLHTDGPVLADGAEIPVERTAVPVEWDQVTRQLDTLTHDLGPDAGGTAGPLTRALDTTSANLDGQGAQLNTTLQQLSQAVTTLSDGREDLFGTVRNLQTFVGALADSDREVDAFQGNLADVSRVLEDNRTQLTTTLTTLDQVLPVVQRFVDDNAGRLDSTVRSLGDVTGTLSQNRQALADLLQIIPTAVSNYNYAYDPLAGSLDGALAFSNLRDPAAFVCATLYSAGGTPEQCKSALDPLLRVAKMDTLPVGASVLERNGRFNSTLPDGSPPTADTGSTPGGATSDGVLGLDRLLAPGLGR